MLEEYLIKQVAHNSKNFIETTDYVGTSVFIIDKSALSDVLVSLIRTIGESSMHKEIGNGDVASVIPQDFFEEFRADECREYNWFDDGDFSLAITDGEASFDPIYFLFLTEVLGLKIFHQDEKKGFYGSKVMDNGLFALVKGNQIVGSVMTLSYSIPNKWVN